MVTPDRAASPDEDLPPAVTFKSGAELLVRLGIVPHITHQGIRHIALNNPEWPFGEGRSHRYWDLANATVMETAPFLEFFRRNYNDGKPR